MLWSLNTASLECRRSSNGVVVGGYKPHTGLSATELKTERGREYSKEFNAMIYQCMIEDMGQYVGGVGVMVNGELHVFKPFIFTHLIDTKAADFTLGIYGGSNGNRLCRFCDELTDNFESCECGQPRKAAEIVAMRARGSKKELKDHSLSKYHHPGR